MTQTRRAAPIAALLLAIALALPSPSQAFLDKTRFAAHLGIAYFAFHHFLLKPYQAGEFANGAPGRTGKIVKAGLALLFTVHEVKVAQKIASTSKDPLLQKLSGGVTGLAASFAGIGAALKGGHFDPKSVDSLNQQTTDVGNGAAADGSPIKDIPLSVPGT